MKYRTLTLAGLLLAVCLAFVAQCTPSKTATRTDMPDIETEVVNGEEVRLSVNIYFNDVHTRHNRAMYERRFTNGLKEIGCVDLRERDESLKFLRDEIDNPSVNYWFGLAEKGEAAPFGQFAEKGVDFVIFFHGQLMGGGTKGASSAACKIYLVDTKAPRVSEFSETEYDVQSFSATYNSATRKFNRHIETAFPEAYKNKVAGMR